MYKQKIDSESRNVESERLPSENSMQNPLEQIPILTGWSKEYKFSEVLDPEKSV
jgi:hypothetical protein